MGKKKRKNLKKELFLDRPTSHGGWPNGGNNSWTGNKPVKDIIYDYLEAMGLTADVPHARLSEQKIKRLIMESLIESKDKPPLDGVIIGMPPKSERGSPYDPLKDLEDSSYEEKLVFMLRSQDDETIMNALVLGSTLGMLTYPDNFLWPNFSFMYGYDFINYQNIQVSESLWNAWSKATGNKYRNRKKHHLLEPGMFDFIAVPVKKHTMDGAELRAMLQSYARAT